MIAAAVLVEVGRSVREAAFMFWTTLWALVFGFGASGAIRSFATRTQLERRLGDHRPAAVARAGAFGMVSSSCSYAASAMARSLVARGADFLTAMVFMFASTNLVVELGVVLTVLLGWQFLAAEFAGGLVMIVLLVVLGAAFLSASRRARIEEDLRGASLETAAELGERDPPPLARRVRDRGAWADAASYAVADLRMLRRELVIGYLAAGFLAVLVPGGAWTALFLRGHGPLTAVENALVGPVIAFASCVCSVGNVPMAAALWHGGISFGGVVSFVFADLVAAPLVLVYRRYYGSAFTLRLVALFWTVMAAAGLVVAEVFSLAGIAPTHRPVRIVATTFHLDATFVLDTVALVVGLAGYVVYRNRDRLGADRDLAVDPVCGMQVRRSTAPAAIVHDGRRHVFCSEHCAARFRAEPDRFLDAPPPAHRAEDPPAPHRHG